jgi:hypothetical protein
MTQLTSGLCDSLHLRVCCVIMLKNIGRPLLSLSLPCRSTPKVALRSRYIVSRAGSGMVRDIEANQAANLLKDAVYLDVR